MQQIEPIVSGGFYHIYNRGINSCDLFTEPANYEYFLKLYDKYISPVAETFAWILMKNHFHLLVKIKDEPEIGLLSNPNPDRVQNPVRVKKTFFADIIRTEENFIKYLTKEGIGELFG